MHEFFSWLRPKSRRDVLGFVGAGIAAVTVAIWTVATHDWTGKQNESLAQTTTTNPNITVSPTISPTINPTFENKPTITVAPSKEPATEVSVEYIVCTGHGGCPWPHSRYNVYLPCGSNIEAWAATQCAKLTRILETETRSGGACGYALFHITCSARK
jgi:hypothetical protein